MDAFSKKLVSVILLFFLALPLVSASDFVVVNSKDWRDIYLGIMFSTLNDSKPLFFDSLSDVDLKTRMIPKNSSVLVLESKVSPVIRNYESFLKIRQYNDVEAFAFNDFSELQVFLYNKIKGRVQNFIVLNPEFGNEAVVAAPLIKNKNFWPVFLTPENLGSVVSNFNLDEQSIAAGYFPSRLIDFFPGIKFTDVPYKNMISLLNYTLNNIDFDWSVLMILDKVDPDVLTSGRPIFIYDENLDLLASLTEEKNVDKFEVVGGELADVAKELEARSGKNLKLLLKYARTITNVKAYSGKLIDIEAFSVDYPFVSLNVENVIFYPQLNTLAVTLSNEGNFPAYLYTNLEFFGKPFSDEHPVEILPGQTLTLPYFLNLSKEKLNQFDSKNASVVLNILYGMDFPLEKTLTDENGRPLIQQKVVVSDYQESISVQLKDHVYDNSRGRLLLKVYNNNSMDITVFAQIFFNESKEVLSSEMVVIPKYSEGTIVVDTPFLYKEDFYNRTLQVSLYYGSKDTLNAKVIPLEITNFYEKSAITGFLIGFVENTKVLIMSIAAVILLIVLILIRRISKKKKY